MEQGNKAEIAEVELDRLPSAIPSHTAQAVNTPSISSPGTASRQAFLDSVAAGRVSSPETMRWYTQRLDAFLSWAAEHHPDNLHSREAFNGFIAHLKTERSLATVRGYVVILRRFGRWLLEEGLAERDPGASLKYPPKGRRVPKGVTPEDFEKLLAVAKHTRDKALLLLLWETGARAEEIIGLHWQDINLEKHSAWVTGKGSKERPVFFGEDGAAMLQAYCETVPNTAEDAVFWALDGETPLTYWGMYLAVKRIGNKAGVEHCNPHRFRHGFGRRLSKNGCPTLVLQDLMGHASSETTRIYTFLDEEDLSRLHERYAGGKA